MVVKNKQIHTLQRIIYLLKHFNMQQIVSKLQRILPRKKLDIFGKDSLMKTSIPYYLLTFLILPGLIQGGAHPFVFIVIIYAVFPILDEIFSFDERNPNTQETAKLHEDQPYFRMALYSAMIFDWAVFFKVMNHMKVVEINWETLPVVIGTTFVVSNLYSVQFAVAHDVMHKPGKFFRILGTLHMIKLYYPHFTYHHLHRHHMHVSTPVDPSSSLKNETVYAFLWRCIKYSWIGVYEDQKKAGKNIITNYAVLSILSTVAFALLVYLVFGMQCMILHSVMAFGSIIYLEAINYLEHYGLQRKLQANGQYEKVTILHSWNAPHRFTNYLFFKLQRHSDHHENASKPYQTLVSMEQSPFLPHGYTLMILMTFFPKVWFRIMNPFVQGYRNLNAQKKELINPELKQTAITETRKFLIEVTLATVSLLLIHLAGLI